MVKIKRAQPNKVFRRFSLKFLLLLVSATLIVIQLLQNKRIQDDHLLKNAENDMSSVLGAGKVISSVSDEGVNKIRTDSNLMKSSSMDTHSCQYNSLSDLKDYEINPQLSDSVDGNGRRHAFQPPKDGIITLVCCETTAGPLSIAVHDRWAPLGAERFLNMVKTGYFSSKVALMRCVRNFICQFGIAGDPKLNKSYTSFPDDPNWLKEGPDFRTNEFGAYRFARGYLAYAGSGKNSRGNQLIMALGDNKRLGGGSPWEVPWGELVGRDSYDTLARISTVYGEKGPSQGLLHREGSSVHVKEQFPKLDYITSCKLVDTRDMTLI